MKLSGSSSSGPAPIGASSNAGASRPSGVRAGIASQASAQTSFTGGSSNVQGGIASRIAGGGAISSFAHSVPGVVPGVGGAFGQGQRATDHAAAIKAQESEKTARYLASAASTIAGGLGDLAATALQSASKGQQAKKSGQDKQNTSQAQEAQQEQQQQEQQPDNLPEFGDDAGGGNDGGGE